MWWDGTRTIGVCKSGTSPFARIFFSRGVARQPLRRGAVSQSPNASTRCARVRDVRYARRWLCVCLTSRRTPLSHVQHALVGGPRQRTLHRNRLCGVHATRTHGGVHVVQARHGVQTVRATTLNMNPDAHVRTMPAIPNATYTVTRSSTQRCHMRNSRSVYIPFDWYEFLFHFHIVHTHACLGVVGRPRVVDVVVGVAPLARPNAADDDAHDALAEYHQ